MSVFRLRFELLYSIQSPDASNRGLSDFGLLQSSRVAGSPSSSGRRGDKTLDLEERSGRRHFAEGRRPRFGYRADRASSASMTLRAAACKCTRVPEHARGWSAPDDPVWFAPLARTQPRSGVKIADRFQMHRVAFHVVEVQRITEPCGKVAVEAVGFPVLVQMHDELVVQQSLYVGLSPGKASFLLSPRVTQKMRVLRSVTRSSQQGDMIALAVIQVLHGRHPRYSRRRGRSLSPGRAAGHASKASRTKG